MFDCYCNLKITVHHKSRNILRCVVEDSGVKSVTRFAKISFTSLHAQFKNLDIWFGREYLAILNTSQQEKHRCRFMKNSNLLHFQGVCLCDMALCHPSPCVCLSGMLQYNKTIINVIHYTCISCCDATK